MLEAIYSSALDPLLAQELASSWGSSGSAIFWGREGEEALRAIH